MPLRAAIRMRSWRYRHSASAAPRRRQRDYAPQSKYVARRKWPTAPHVRHAISPPSVSFKIHQGRRPAPARSEGDTGMTRYFQYSIGGGIGITIRFGPSPPAAAVTFGHGRMPGQATSLSCISSTLYRHIRPAYLLERCEAKRCLSDYDSMR